MCSLSPVYVTATGVPAPLELRPEGWALDSLVAQAVQGCVPLIIQNEEDSQTDVDQAFEELLPYANFSLR